MIISSAVSIDTTDLAQENRFNRQLRRADLFIQLAVTAAHKALETADCKLIPQETGIIIGTAYGPMETNFEVLDLIVEEEQTSPTLFSHSVFNAAAGYIARICNIRGSAMTLTDFCWPFFQALQQSFSALATGRLSHCLVLQVETYSHLLADARKRTEQNTSTLWPAGAVAWLLTTTACEENSGNIRLNQLEIVTQPGEPEAYLYEHPLLTSSGRKIQCTTPLTAASVLTQGVQWDRGQNAQVSITASYGTIQLRFNSSSPVSCPD